MKSSFLVKSFAAAAALSAISASAFAALTAADNASNAAYSGGNWTVSTNGGTGFGAWSFSAAGAGGSYIGVTAQSATSFGIFTGTPTAGEDSMTVNRPFTGALANGQTFSVDLGQTGVETSGVVGLNLLDGATVVFTLKLIGPSASASWTLNDGGSDFGISQTASPNTSLAFSFTLNNGASKNYSYSFGSASGSGFIATSTLSNITGVRFFTSEQGAGGNVGINNLAIIPEPATATLLGAATLLLLGRTRRRGKS